MLTKSMWNANSGNADTYDDNKNNNDTDENEMNANDNGKIT